MPFVLDASICASWFLPDESDPAANLAFDLLRVDYAFVPAIWWYEIHNILLSNERRRRLTEQQVDGCLKALQEFTIDIDQTFEQADIIPIGLKIYSCK
jgi:predicted nucleic acid-binding protein